MCMEFHLEFWLKFHLGYLPGHLNLGGVRDASRVYF